MIAAIRIAALFGGLILLFAGLGAQEAAPPATPPPDSGAQPPAQAVPATPKKIECANLIYGGSKSSVCFSDKFMETVKRETNILPAPHFKTVRLGRDELFDYPFSVMTGEGAFSMTEDERKNLRAYLERGGFLLASAGCSSRDWDKAFRADIKKVFPEIEFKPLTMDHPIFHSVFDITDIRLKKGGSAKLEGLEIDGRIVMIYSQEGLNDTGNVHGCCCCGGNEVLNCHEINVNIFVYALTH